MKPILSEAELSQKLSDPTAFLLLITDEGQIWAGSEAAQGLFGYSSDELKTLCLVDIQPKRLRLSDVLKAQKTSASPVVFQRKNQRRFSALCHVNRMAVNYENTVLELSEMVLTPVTSLPRNEGADTLNFNLYEAGEYVNRLYSESRFPLNQIRDVANLAGSHSNKGLTGNQNRLLNNAVDHLEILFSNVTDCYKLGVNGLELDMQPFSILDLLGEFIQNWEIKRTRVTTVVGRHAPELVFGDQIRVQKILDNLAQKSMELFEPKSMVLHVDGSAGDAIQRQLRFDLGINIGKRDFAHDHDKLLDLFDQSPYVYFCKNLIRLMGGNLTLTAESEFDIQASFRLDLAEVHDLGVTGNRQFLQGVHVLLIDDIDTQIKRMLQAWSATIHQLTDWPLQQPFSSTLIKQADIILIRRHKESLAWVNKIHQQRVGASVPIVLFDETAPWQADKKVVALLPGTPLAEIGNLLADLVGQDAPYPYAKSSDKRMQLAVSHKRHVLLVDDNPSFRRQTQLKLEQLGFAVDSALNGIDGVIACTKVHYEFIFIAIDLVVMDGFETAAHIRESRGLNTHSGIVFIADALTQNHRQAMHQVGFEHVFMRGMSIEQLRELVELVRDESFALKTTKGSLEPLNSARFDSLFHQSQYAQSYHASRSNGRILNEETINQLRADIGTEVFNEMRQVFIDDILSVVSKLETQCRQGDWQAVGVNAKEAASSSKTFGCSLLHHIAMRLYQASVRENDSDCIALSIELKKVFLETQKALARA